MLYLTHVSKVFHNHLINMVCYVFIVQGHQNPSSRNGFNQWECRNALGEGMCHQSLCVFFFDFIASISVYLGMYVYVYVAICIYMCVRV